MLNGRLYRAAFVPFLFALAVAAFSLGSRPPALTSTLAPDAFEGAPAFAELRSLAASFPRRRPGSGGDAALARYVARKLEGLGGTAGGGFTVRTYGVRAQTIDGERTLRTVVAERPGSTGATPILIVAHRDAAARGSAAELSGTAALLELARVFATRETKRTIVLASTSGGSGGDASAARLASQLAQVGSATAGAGQGLFDAAIVLGDVAGVHASGPLVVPFSDGLGSAPLQLQRTVQAAVTSQAATNPGAQGALTQLAHLAFPLTVGEQGVLNAAGIPAVLVQSSGERPPPSREAISAARLEGLGRAVLSAVDALDTAPNVPHAAQTDLLLGRKTMPSWALRLLVAMLLVAPLAGAVDGLARLRRRGLPVGRWTLWALSCALPFLLCALFARLLGAVGIFGAAPSAPAPPGALPLGARAATAIAAVALTFALAWMLWGALLRRLRLGARPDPDVAGLALALVLLAVLALAWALNPFAALLGVPALHLWLALADVDRLEVQERTRRAASLALVALGVLPLALLIVLYASQLGLGAGGVAWMGLALLAGGHVDLGAAVLWSLALGCAAGAAMLALSPLPAPAGGPFAGEAEVTIRGPLSYAGPGSLGGTESALRR